MNIAHKSSFVLSSRHLLGIEALSRDDIVGLLDLAEEFVVLNRQIEKKTASPNPWMLLPCRPLSYDHISVEQTRSTTTERHRAMITRARRRR